MNGFDAVRDLSLHVEDCTLERHELSTSSGFDRVTTEIRLHGPEAVGVGEDVTYETDHHDDLQATGAPPLSGTYEFGTFSEIVGDLDLFPDGGPERPAFVDYRRWGFESAALDLALKQAEVSLARALDGTYDPVSFLASTRLGDPPSADRLTGFRERVPDIEFKLDPTADWDEELIEAVAEVGGVRILDLKGHYQGTDVDGDPDPELYDRLLSTFPDAVIEDPAITDATEPVLAGEYDRLSWDAPIHAVADLDELPDVGWLNIKPSRFGSVRELLAAIETCDRRNIDVYVGGQFELGPGRDHLHALASLICPDAPNDAAPPAYNRRDLPAALPSSPLDPPDDPVGLEW